MEETGPAPEKKTGMDLLLSGGIPMLPLTRVLPSDEIAKIFTFSMGTVTDEGKKIGEILLKNAVRNFTFSATGAVDTEMHFALVVADTPFICQVCLTPVDQETNDKYMEMALNNSAPHRTVSEQLEAVITNKKNAAKKRLMLEAFIGALKEELNSHTCDKTPEEKQQCECNRCLIEHALEQATKKRAGEESKTE